ncbi:hypothetical protein E3N88_07384 [Mikania micrantha]|uniref:Uncharacterized protein n=1 Tax=Mikania micrantha TaxID=192012 RepID=A0A5N6PRG6_9ASTR|nr:hypothetical protein E3N88_07384 [Mikania micrantha]
MWIPSSNPPSSFILIVSGMSHSIPMAVALTMANDEVHEFLQFDARSKATTRLAAYEHKSFEAARTIDWSILKELDVEDRARDFLPRPWIRFIDIKKPQF